MTCFKQLLLLHDKAWGKVTGIWGVMILKPRRPVVESMVIISRGSFAWQKPPGGISGKQ